MTGVKARRAARPVFLDRSGRRRRLVVASGATAGAVVVLVLIMLVAGLTGASPLPLPGFPDLGGPAPVSPAQPPRTAGTPSHPGNGDGGATGGDASATAGVSSSPRGGPTQTPSHPGNGTGGGGSGGGRPSRS